MDKLVSQTERTTDFCVIGGGPAGIILALELSRLNPDKKILLIEFGTKQKNSLDDSIEIRNLLNHHPPYECTNKGLGGTSATWGGRCVMYDEVDFIDRPIINGNCTWNVDLFKEMDQYLSQAAAYFECGDAVFNLNATENKNRRIAEGFIEGDVTDSVVERWSMPTRFGRRYAGELKNANNLTVLDGYEARNFSAPDSEGKIKSLFIRDTDSGKVMEVVSSDFILAMGAQETTRMLLRNPHLFTNIGKPPNALGKYYQGHLSGKIASVKFDGNPDKTDFGFSRDADGVYLRRRFQFTTDFLVKNNLLNTAIWLDNPLYHNPKHKSGAMSFMYMAMITPVIGKKLAPPAIAQSITKGKVEGLHKHLFNIIKDLPGSLIKPISIFYRRYCLNRKLPGVFLYSPHNRYALHFHAEQIPVETNKMELAADGETLVIHYSLTDADVASVIQLHQKLDEWLRKTGSGKLEYWYSEEELPEAIKKMSRDGIHQSGTTRIAATANEGVVDSNLKVFGTDNIYICSSSLFPTSGQANPTFFLGAFAVRLANHLTHK
jgi:hypothetical protein